MSVSRYLPAAILSLSVLRISFDMPSRSSRTARRTPRLPRSRVGAVNPTLMDIYRAGELNLDQMIAFAVSEDHARQAEMFVQLGPHRPP